MLLVSDISIYISSVNFGSRLKDDEDIDQENEEAAASVSEGPLGAVNEEVGRPALPTDVQLITATSGSGQAARAVDLRNPKNKKMFINPQGKTSITVLHEYVQKIMKGNVCR